MTSTPILPTSGAMPSPFAGAQNRPQAQPYSLPGVTNDRLDLSALAVGRYQTLRAAESVTKMGAGAGRKYKTIEEVGQDLSADLADFANFFGGFLRQANIDTGTPLVLRPDGKGSLRVQGEHPDAATVEEATGQGSVFTARFMVIAARSALVNAAETDPAFRTDYAADPYQAIRTHIDGLKERLLNFEMRIENGAIHTAHTAPAAAAA